MAEAESWQVSDDAAEIYERDFVPGLFAPWAPVVAAAAEIAPGDRVLDVGCGTGALTREVRRRAGERGAVAGLDLNPGMLAVAGRQAPEIAWREGDAAALPFAAESFDAVVSQFVLMFVEDRAAALREMHRVLKPGGRLAIAVWDAIDRVPAQKALAGILGRRAGAEAEAMLHTPYALWDAAAMVRWLEEAGFPDVKLATQSGEARFPSLEEFLRIEIKGTPLAGMVDEASYRQVLADSRRELLPLNTGRGDFRFPMHAHVFTARKA